MITNRAEERPNPLVVEASSGGPREHGEDKGLHREGHLWGRGHPQPGDTRRSEKVDARDRVEKSRRLILTAALSILIIGGMGATFALAQPTSCQYAAACYTTTVTVTAQAPTGATFLDLTSNGQPVITALHPMGRCYTQAEYQALIPNYPDGLAGSPDANCHGVPN